MNADPAFALERFAWDGPDRLALSGWFSGLAPEAGTAPVLVLHGTEHIRRLEVDADDVPLDGRHWSATFAWEEPPEAFDAAALELGSGLVVPLPDPSPENRLRGDAVFSVRAVTANHGAGADRLRLEGELLTAQEEVEEMRVALTRATEELARARADLEDERRRHTSDAERYRDGLARVRATAEQTLAEARAGVDAERARTEEIARRFAQVQAPVAKAREDMSLLLGLFATIERALDEPE